MTSLERAFEEFDRFVEHRMTEVNMPGLVLAVTDREKLLRVVPFGYADLASGRPMQPSSMFEIGSIGKSFTNVALMQLRDEGRLNLHEPVSRYLPWFDVQSGFGPITPHHLMTHTSGLVTGTDIGPHGLYESWALRGSRTGAPPWRVLPLLEYRIQDFGFPTGGSGRKIISTRYTKESTRSPGHARFPPSHWIRDTKAGGRRLPKLL